MSLLGLGLHDAEHYEDALSVREAEMAWMRRLGASQHNILAAQTNLANTYRALGRLEDASRMQRDVYSGRLKLNGEENRRTLVSASNYASTLSELRRFEEAKSLLRRTMPVARRVLREGDEQMLRKCYFNAEALCKDD